MGFGKVFLQRGPQSWVAVGSACGYRSQARSRGHAQRLRTSSGTPPFASPRTHLRAASAAQPPRRRAWMAAQARLPSLVSAEWLGKNLATARLLDATWHMPGTQAEGAPAAEFAAERIPGARFFDLDGVCDRSTDLPHMLPSEAQFAAAADALGIGNDDTVVVYDRHGLFSAPRAWWTWHVMGHDRVAVLDGGLPAWKTAGGELETTPVDAASVHAAEAASQGAPPPGWVPRYRTKLRAEEVRTWKQVWSNIEQQVEVVVDARPAPRWRGEAPEPRPGLKAGHVPGSCNVPWTSVLTADNKMRLPEELRKIFGDAGVDVSRPLVTSCGSGTTACIVALAARELDPGATVAIYDGSWSEWGALPHVPVATSAARLDE